MAASLREVVNQYCNFSLRHLNNIWLRIFRPPFGPVPAISGIPIQSFPEENTLEKDDGILRGVPKRRRSVEQRWKRRSGIIESLQIKYKLNLVVCDECGHHHVAHTLCGNCYERVKQETELLRDSIQEKLGLKPVEKEVRIRYTNDPISRDTPSNHMTVEIPKERPSWFTKGLLSKAIHKPTQAPIPESVSPKKTSDE